MSTVEFWSKYEQLASDLVRPLGPEDQVPETEIVAAEDRLSFRLPRLLREYYLRAGRLSEINEAFNRLLPPGDLWIEAEWLVFYEEHQGAFVWGIRRDDAGVEDPPVYQGVWNADTKRWEWYPEHQRLSEFLVATFYWQLASTETYGVEERHTFEIDEEVLAAIRRQWHREDVDGEVVGFEVYRRGSQVLWVLHDGNQLKLWIAGASDEDIASAVGHLGLQTRGGLAS
jgi:hypothetical protein